MRVLRRCASVTIFAQRFAFRNWTLTPIEAFHDAWRWFCPQGSQPEGGVAGLRPAQRAKPPHKPRFFASQRTARLRFVGSPEGADVQWAPSRSPNVVNVLMHRDRHRDQLRCACLLQRLYASRNRLGCSQTRLHVVNRLHITQPSQEPLGHMER